MNERIPLPWSRSCYVCGEDNPDGFRARSFKVGERIELPFVAERRFAGWNQVIHGGIIATLLDEVMTWAAILGSDKPCFAAEFTVRLLKPLPPETHCVAVARMVSGRRRVFDTESWVEDEEGTVYARGSGRYMPVPPEQTKHLRQDFVRDEHCLQLDGIFGG